MSLTYGTSLSQSVYLTMDRDEVVKMLRERDIEVMESDSVYVHAVDDRLLRNLIFHFEGGKCKKMFTTFQQEQGFLRMLDFLNRNHKEIGTMSWMLPMENGTDVVKAYREVGFDVIEESFKPDK